MGTQPLGGLGDSQKSALIERIIRGELTPQQACERHGLSSVELKEWVRVYRREARRAFDERVDAALSYHGMEVGEAAGAVFSGKVEDLAVGELVQTVQFGRKDAEIVIEHDGERSYLWCIDGNVVDAKSGNLQGVAAVYRLLALERGHIHADFSPIKRTQVIRASTQALMLEAARRSDECRQLRRRTGDTTIIYIPSDRALSPQVEASPDQFGVLRLFDGERSLEQVVVQSHLPDLETLTHIVALGEKGLLEPSQAPRSSQLTLPVAPESEKPELSFLPFAASLGVPPAQRIAPRRWLWMGVAAGAASLGSVFALRMSAAIDAAQALAGAGPIPVLAAPAATPVPAPVARGRIEPCPADMVLLRGPHPFCIGKHEVSAGDYAACKMTGRCEAGLHQTELPELPLSSEARKRVQALLSAQCNAEQPGRERHPMNCVTEKQAERYCGAYAGRLPTEAEWEIAAEGKDESAFPWGAARPGALEANACGSECRAWYAATDLAGAFGGVMFDADDGYVGTAPVGSFPAGASPEGVLDLIGNVAEWTSSQVEFDDAEGADKTAGPFVVRGGDFSSGVEALSQPALRAYLSDDTRSRTVGFRCAADPSDTGRGAPPSD